MTDTLSRAFTGDLEVRADASGRTITGIIVPFGREARVSDGGPSYLESFQMGAFAKTIAESGDRVKLLYQHNSREPIGKATMLREDSAGLYGEFRVSSVAAGDQALELVRDGVIDSFSVGFTPVKHVKRGNVTVRTEVAMREASLVTFPAYADARVGGIRSLMAAIGDLEPEARAELERMLAGARDLTEADPTPDGEPGQIDPSEPASATRDASMIRLTLRALAREKGIL